MAKAVWHHTDRKTGARTEVWLDERQQEDDARCVQEFEGIEAALFADAKHDVAKDERVATILKLSAGLPPLKRQHWRDELERIGATVPAEAKEEKPVGKRARPKDSSEIDV